MRAKSDYLLHGFAVSLLEYTSTVELTRDADVEIEHGDSDGL